MDDLYKQYGQLSVQAEVLQGQLNAVRKQINDELSKPVKEKK